MTTKLNLISHINPNPNPNSSPSMATSLATSVRIAAALRHHHHHHHQSQLTSAASLCVSPKGLGTRLLSVDSRRRSKSHRFVVSSFDASHEDSNHEEINVEEGKSELDAGTKESQEEWEQILQSFKEKAIKMQGISQEAYEVYSKKAIVILKETSEKLKIQAEKAKQDIGIIAKEISEESKEYLSVAAEKSPEEMKDIVETFTSSPDDLKEMSKVRDFYLGIPYGGILSLGGFLSFMLTGSISAIRFGVILGGTLLALSISSLKSWKRGESSALALKGQAAIAGIIFLRELKLLFQRPSFLSYLPTLISGAMVGFYIYRVMVDGDKNKGPSMEHGSKN